MDGIINLLKGAGMTSSDAVVRARGITGERKIGHGGTLDPAAAGVLPLLVGRATRLFDEIADKRKTYLAEFTLGVGTDTLDADGVITERSDAAVSRRELDGALARFRGAITQRPPLYSAVKRDGRRAADLARRGLTPDMPERPAVIYRFELVRQTGPGRYLMEIECSRGTYIRSLCRDVARAAGTCGYVSFLLRTRSGPYALDGALTLEQLESRWRADPGSALRPMDEPLLHLPPLALDPAQARALRDGRSAAVSPPWPEGSSVRLYDGERFMGTGRLIREENRACVRVKTLLERRES